MAKVHHRSPSKLTQTRPPVKEFSLTTPYESYPDEEPRPRSGVPDPVPRDRARSTDQTIPVQLSDPPPELFSPPYTTASTTAPTSYEPPPPEVVPVNGALDQASAREIVVPAVPDNPPPASAQARALSEMAPLPIPGAGQPRGNPVRIGLWGAGRAGKSTYLASLPLAGIQDPLGQWLVTGSDQAAAEYLNMSVSRLVVEKRFPRPNRVTEPVSWTFHYTPKPGMSGFMRPRKSDPMAFELFDPPGRFYHADAIAPEVVEHLASASGILYLIDPERPEDDRSFDHFFGTLNMLYSAMDRQGGLKRGRLRQYLAVCVTKFDDEQFFRRLVDTTDFVVQDPKGARLPRIPQHRAKEFFEWVCDRVLGGGASLVREAIGRFFHESRVQYFATSAIGFRLNSQGIFDFRDFSNVVAGSDPSDRMLRDRPRPINTLEPLVFLEQHVRSGKL
jgi:hypothetical protein